MEKENDLNYIKKDFLSEESKNIFFEILPPKTKPIIVRIVYRPPNLNNFYKLWMKIFSNLILSKNNFTFLVTSI